MLYEYEKLSLQAYSPAANRYLGSNNPSPHQCNTTYAAQQELLLFENPDNLGIKQEFSIVMATAVNPFVTLKLWLMYEVLEIEALMETFQLRTKIQR